MKQLCCICNKPINDGFGNDAWPVKDNGECCDECNINIVLPKRLEMMHRKKFKIRYTETYASDYIIEASTYEEAIQKLDDDIRNGRQEGPDECIDSSYSNLMDLVIYQIITDKDKNSIAFMGYDYLPRFQGSDKVDAAIYGKVYEGIVKARNLEDIYEKFNLERPEDFYGRSMSVSDIVGIKDPVTAEVTYYFCDRFGFKEVPFDASLAEDM